MTSSILWFRRDLRLHDHPALNAAVEQAGASGVVPLFVIEPALWDGAGDSRRRWLAATLRSLDAECNGRLTVRRGDPAKVVAQVAREQHADTVHVSRETTPYGRRRDERVTAALGDDISLAETGTPYAVGPGVITNGSGSPYKVFTAFSRAWQDHGWPAPAERPSRIHWVDGGSGDDAHELIADAAEGELDFAVGEDAAHQRWEDFLDGPVDHYGTDRDRPAKDGTSRLSPYLKLGVLHPRTLLADLAHKRSDGAQTYRTEIAWREFYADVLWHQPRSSWHDLRDQLSGMTYDEPKEAIEAWKAGKTGYPIVDAGMRQLLQTGWMHNRLRMITASFLTKDLHVWWPVGARHFLDHLVDGDVASNNHGWQWVAGTGTDASPYFRVFNPVTQGQKFDPDGAYVRRWVPELRHLQGKATHEPWTVDDGYAEGYPERIVDHADERKEALRRYESAR
ncbi:cryptochrome/photolyase family protein [Allobranchiibius huperziae]|uniref:Deoxyribodipyrimidine photo-lyase n=1 Tax=Allobranchiibius huperziae TaxID=1874116 RepID=A0A853DD96_9MICO|nr:deoxyribodipyrimidine photo-lyase [Allobranchiibius huperziae]NYJ74577.1 deoxyribodipyrimidine photo-lyase [Allobranchiibius huperziae]